MLTVEDIEEEILDSIMLYMAHADNFTTNIKLSKISWASKARMIYGWFWSVQCPISYIVEKTGYRKDYIREYLLLGRYLQSCPKLAKYKRREALKIVRDFKDAKKINEYISYSL